MQGIVTQVLGSRNYLVNIQGQLWKRHIDQLIKSRVNEQPGCLTSFPVNDPAGLESESVSGSPVTSAYLAQIRVYRIVEVIICHNLTAMHHKSSRNLSQNSKFQSCRKGLKQRVFLECHPSLNQRDVILQELEQLQVTYKTMNVKDIIRLVVLCYYQFFPLP